MARVPTSMANYRNTGPSGRVTRTPVHPWLLQTKPFQLQPMCIAPVLPGETLRNILWQSRVVTDPVLNPLIGWHLEYYWFYVKHRDLDTPQDFIDMMLDFNKNMSGRFEAADVKWHHYANTINWTKLCTKRIVEEYFRDEAEDWLTGAHIDNVPLVKSKHNESSWLQSAVLTSQLTALDVKINVDATPTPDQVSARDIDAALAQWQFLRQNNLTDMDYEQYLRSFGVRVRTEEQNIPELLRYTSEWSYPSNTINPTTGAPVSAISWAVTQRADKDRFFKEPGFIVGLTCCRPKTYRANQDGGAIGLLNNAFAWLPAIMDNDPATSLRSVPGGTGPLAAVNASTPGDDYTVDLKDLFVRGDQFVNFATAGGSNNMVALPTTDLGEKSYVSATDAAGLFVDSGGTAITIRQDGVASLSITGHARDTTPESGTIRI